LRKLINFIVFIFLFISSISSAQDSFNIVTTKLKKGDTFYKVFSDIKINKNDSKLFINSLNRRLDLNRMPTGQEIKFYFTNNSSLLLAVAVPLKKDFTVLTWRKDKKIVSVKIGNDFLNDRVKALINREEFIPKPRLYKIKVNKGDNLTKLLSNAAININEIQNIIRIISEQKDLRKLMPNDEVQLFYVANSEGVFLDKINLIMSGSSIILKKDSFKVFRLYKNDEKIDIINDRNIDVNEIKAIKIDIVLGQLRGSGWSGKEAREGIDAFSTVHDPVNISKNEELIFPKDKNIRAFAIKISNDAAVLVRKIENGNFLAKRLSFQETIRVIDSLKINEKEDLIIKNDDLNNNNIKIYETDAAEDSDVKIDDLYFKTNLIEGKIAKGDTLIARLLALGEKKSTIMNALEVLSKEMDPNLVRSGSFLIVALGTDSTPMKGFFIERKRNKGYLVVIENNRYIVKYVRLDKAKNRLAELVKPNLIKRKKIIDIIPEWKATSIVKPFQNNVKIFTFKSGDTLSHAFSSIGVPEREIFGFINKLKNEFDPKKLKVGNKLKFYLSKKNTKLVNGIALHIDKVRSIEVFKVENNYTLNKYKEPIIVTFHKVSGEINNSLYVSAKNAGLPISVLMEVVKIYSFDVDFQREIKSGDAFEVLYQINNNKSGEVVSNGPVIRSVLVLAGERLPLYRYEYEVGYFGYFDSDANSAKKALMRTPLDGARITSGFGKRKHPILGYTKMHKGVDFAAPRNTPVFAAGDGVIEFSRRNGGYGKYIRIRHNSDYKTSYAHLARFAKNIKEGKRIKQGDVIGYVGTTGRSTGPHLHYEILFRNKQVNPLKVRMPKELKLKNKDYDTFIIERNKLDNIWDSL
jgi:murein DD-endopeptidase MepM/ murein hydrolase activator NlpD